MEKYLMDFFDEVASGKYGRTKVTRSNIPVFLEKATKEELDMIDDLYFEWTSILTEPEDIDMEEFHNIFLPVLKR